MRQAILLAAAILYGSAATAEDMRLCGGKFGATSADGRLLNHFPYPVATPAELARPPRALAGQCAAVHRDMLGDLDDMLAHARADADVGNALVAVSCFRSRQYQARVFCRQGRSVAPLAKAYQVAPPGFSEHATGLAIDFGDRSGRCKLVACFADTAAGRWLAKNAPAYGFELSFPKDNVQGVAFEPWHWRWVGRDNDAGRSKFAQAVFAAAHQRFPAADKAAATAPPILNAAVPVAERPPAPGTGTAAPPLPLMAWPPAGIRGATGPLAEP